MKFPFLAWAIAQRGSQFRFAASLGQTEAWLSRRMTGRTPFSPEDRLLIAARLGYPSNWLFRTPVPPCDSDASETRESGAVS
jgi:hypothetical protein